MGKEGIEGEEMEGERNEEERRGRGLLNVPTVPNFPSHH